VCVWCVVWEEGALCNRGVPGECVWCDVDIGGLG